MTLLPKDNRKSFWSEDSAKRFSKKLENNGYEPEIWSDYDRLNKCCIYIVMWDNK